MRLLDTIHPNPKVEITPIGKTVQVEIMRDGAMKTVSVAIGKLNDRTAAMGPGQEKSAWGLALQNIRPEDRTHMNLPAKEGVLVQAVVPGSPAADAGMQPGDVILQVNKVPVRSVKGVKQEAAKTKSDEPMLLLVRRADGSTMFAALSHNIG